MRLDTKTSAQRVLQYYLTPHERPVVSAILTWLAQITKDIKSTHKYHQIRIPLERKSLTDSDFLEENSRRQERLADGRDEQYVEELGGAPHLHPFTISHLVDSITSTNMKLSE